MKQVTIEAVIAAYRKTRDEDIPALESKINELKKTQGAREEWLDQQLTLQGVDSFKVKGVGMVGYTTQTSATVADRQSFFNWIKEDPANRLDFLQARASKDQVVTMLDEQKALPPGINYTTIKKVVVRKA
jgi:hypothetical protein